MASRVTGYRESASALRELTNFAATPANEASRFALRPVVYEARKQLKAMGAVKTGTLCKSLTIKRDPDSPRSRPRHVVGPDSKSPSVRYAHLVELGTAPHKNEGIFAGTDHPGTAPKPFLRAAYEATKTAVVARFGERLGTAMEKRAARLRSKVRGR